MILPQMEQNPLYQSIDFNVPMNDAFQGHYQITRRFLISSANRNTRAAATIVPTYLCPSDPFTITDVLGPNPPATW